MQNNEINPELIMKSLTSKIAQLTFDNAVKDAYIQDLEKRLAEKETEG